MYVFLCAGGRPSMRPCCDPRGRYERNPCCSSDASPYALIPINSDHLATRHVHSNLITYPYLSFALMFQSVYLWSLVGLSVVHLVSGAPTPSPRATCELDFPGFKLQGKSTGDGACRYTVKYGQAARWQDAVRATEQT